MKALEGESSLKEVVEQNKNGEWDMNLTLNSIGYER